MKRVNSIGPLLDPVIWYGINYTGTQITQWDFQNRGTRTSPAQLSFVLKVPLRNLRPSVIYSVPCDRIVQRAYCRHMQDMDKPTKRRTLRTTVFYFLDSLSLFSCPSVSLHSQLRQSLVPLMSTTLGFHSRDQQPCFLTETKKQFA